MPRTHKPIRWTIEAAATEFGLDRKTLTKGINARSLTAGHDGKFSTAEICAAVFSDKDAAQTALAAAQTEGHALKNQKLAGTLADAALFQKESDNVILILRQKITDANIPENIKADLLNDIQKINVDEIINANSKPDPEDLDEQP